MTVKEYKDGITVLMPTYNQGQFICRAVKSLQLQSFRKWELIIINDGSPDDTVEIVKTFLGDCRIKYFQNTKNEGLAYCLNLGLKHSDLRFIAYLPSDDVYFSDHLQKLYTLLDQNENAVLTWADRKIQNHPGWLNESLAEGEERPIQLVQILHKRTSDLWIERSELVTDDYRKLFFNKLERHGEFVFHNEITCEWVEHNEQMSKIINEKFDGGIYRYKSYYNVSGPLTFQSSGGNYICEADRYGNIGKNNKSYKEGKKQLKILLVGELAFNPERIVAFEEQGHKLYGLWMKNPSFINTIGPLQFGNVEDIPYENWQARVHEIKPDIIYALLNWKTVPFAHEILTNNESIPFVWHFKEDPFFCINQGSWRQLVDLFTLCDGRIFTNQELKAWFELSLPEKNIPSFVLDGDLPKRDWFMEERSPLLSDTDGEIHTVLPGRAMGFKIEDIIPLAAQKIHFHFYGEVFHKPIKNYFLANPSIAGNYAHFHPNCDPKDWVKEFSQYDAGWLHLFDSSNNGELTRASWDDLNYPARLSTYAAAGLPMLLKDNSGHLVAMEALVRKLDVGIPFRRFEDLGPIFSDSIRMKELRTNMWDKRKVFQFDSHVDELTVFFENVINTAGRSI